MGAFAYTRETFNNVLSDVRISYYIHRLNAQALAMTAEKVTFNKDSPEYNKNVISKLWLESIKETTFAYTLPIFHIIKLPVFLTVAAFAEVFNGVKSYFNYFFRRNKNNAQNNADIDNEEDLNDMQLEISENKDYFVNESIENYFKPQLIIVNFSNGLDFSWRKAIENTINDNSSFPRDLWDLDLEGSDARVNKRVNKKEITFKT